MKKGKLLSLLLAAVILIFMKVMKKIDTKEN